MGRLPATSAVRAFAMLLVLLTACARQPQPVVDVSPTPEAGLLEITVLLDLSGERAPRGDAQRNALALWNDLAQARGRGPVRTRVTVVDVGGSDARLLIELRRAAVEARADAAIIGVPVSFAAPGFAEAVEAAGLPILLTLPVDEPVGQRGGRWAFAIAPTPDQIARKVSAITDSPLDTVVITADGRPADPEIVAILREWQRAARAPQELRLDRRDESLQAAVRVAAAARRIHLAGAPRYWSTLGSAAKQVGRAPTFVLSYLTDHNELGEFRDGIDAVWPAPLHLTLAGIPPNSSAGARRQFVQSYTERHGPPTAHAVAAYDALSALVLAAERAGTDDRERMREQLEHTTLAGIATTYAFSVTRHAGHSGEDLALYRWSGGAPVLDTRR